MFEKEILPLLKKQNGFVDELLLVTPEKKEVVAISLEKKEYAEIHNRKLYSEVEKMLEKFIEGFPIINNFEAEYSTFHKIAIATVV
jgi:hypothetical protein